MTTKTQNIMVLAILSVAIVSITGIHVVDAAQQPIDNIPTSQVIERTTEAWSDQYESSEEFSKVTRETVEYLTADLEPGWNTDVQQASLKTYNFESMIGKRNSVNELVSLFSAKEQILGTYTRADSVSNYHDWMQTQFDTPKTIDAIDKRIYEIIGEESNYALAIESYEARNFQASLGAVPEELIQSQPLIWGKVLLLAGCSYDETCDVEEMSRIADFKHPDPNQEQLVIPQGTEASLYDYILPKAYAAWDEVAHTAYQYISANTCDGSPCSFYTYSSNGVGVKTPNASSGGIHTTDTTIYSYASDTSSSSGHYHSIVSQLTDPAPTNTLVGSGYGTTVWKDGYLTKSSSETTYKATNTANAWLP